MDTPAFERWLDDYGRAWEGGDPAAAALLFTEEATYQETPFDEPMRGRAAIRAYWENVPRSQREIKFTREVLGFTGKGEGIARWSASFLRVPSGTRVELEGILIARFESGQCAEFREWWHSRDG